MRKEINLHELHTWKRREYTLYATTEASFHGKHVEFSVNYEGQYRVTVAGEVLYEGSSLHVAKEAFENGEIPA